MIFSIVVPVFNVESKLNRCIQSILNQKFADYEIILVDDGSKDSSPLICEKFSKEYDFIKVIHKENGGPASARRDAAKIVKGDYILSIDADDYVDADFLEKINDAILSNNYPDCVAWGFKRIDGKTGRCVNLVKQCEREGLFNNESLESLKEKLLYDKSQPNLNYGGLLYSVWTKAIKKELYIDAVNSIKSNIFYGEDLIISKRVLSNSKSKSLVVINYFGYNYVDNYDSVINCSYSLEKFKKYEETVLELNLCFCDETEKVQIFSMRAIISLLGSMCASAGSYKAFISKVKESYSCENIWNFAKKAKIKKGFKDKIKIFLVKRHHFKFIYKYFKR